ncbi:MAG: histidine phosphatase family protein [Pseudomonadota bacterium]
MLVYFVRHCPVIRQRTRPVANWQLALDVTDAERRIGSLMRALSFEEIVTSPEQKAIQTSRRLFGNHRLMKTDNRLRELHRSGYVQDYETQVAAVFSQPSVSVNRWESAEKCQRRALAALNDFADKGFNRICICGHGLQGALLRSFCLRQRYASLIDWAAIGSPDCMIVRVEPDGDLNLVEDFRGVTHQDTHTAVTG